MVTNEKYSDSLLLSSRFFSQAAYYSLFPFLAIIMTSYFKVGLQTVGISIGIFIVISRFILFPLGALVDKYGGKYFIIYANLVSMLAVSALIFIPKDASLAAHFLVFIRIKTETLLFMLGYVIQFALLQMFIFCFSYFSLHYFNNIKLASGFFSIQALIVIPVMYLCYNKYRAIENFNKSWLFIIGVSIFAFSYVLLGLTASFINPILSVFILCILITISEVISSPIADSYLASLGAKNQSGIVFSTATLFEALGTGIGIFLGSKALEIFSSEKSLLPRIWSVSSAVCFFLLMIIFILLIINSLKTVNSNCKSEKDKLTAKLI
ncbi:hypothetical protein [Fluviispira vulneris]|uniref:hypothetical protein n=1 Tax=Fluviispira vulneris TaxID=2763012 RepID=UPI001648A761|nr:hypothetical protein [Fluviispira vulneris]